MGAIETRFALFLFGCIPVRSALVLAALLAPTRWLKAFAVPAAALAVAFWLIFVLGWRRSGPETLGAPIWWNTLRPVHGTIWAFAAYYAWVGNRAALWRLLLLDVCIGFVSFAAHHALRS